MYNPQLETFIRTADAGSFNKAAEEVYSIMRYCKDAVIRAKNDMQEDENIIRISSSPVTPAQLLMQLWSKVQENCPDMKFQIVPFENIPENAREILANLGKNIDVIGGVFDETMLELRNCAGTGAVCNGEKIFDGNAGCPVDERSSLCAHKQLRSKKN